jgi:hypothetical protein
MRVVRVLKSKVPHSGTKRIFRAAPPGFAPLSVGGFSILTPNLSLSSNEIILGVRKTPIIFAFALPLLYFRLWSLLQADDQGCNSVQATSLRFERRSCEPPSLQQQSLQSQCHQFEYLGLWNFGALHLNSRELQQFSSAHSLDSTTFTRVLFSQSFPRAPCTI